MVEINLFNIPTFSDSRGCLTVLEKLLPFPIKRVYWIYSADGQKRGGHRHIHTIQALIAISGKINLTVWDDTDNKEIVLDKPDLCLIVEPKHWHTMEFHENAVLLVLSSHEYSQSDYIYPDK